MIRITNWYNTTRCNDCNLSFAKIFNCFSWLYTVEFRHRKICLKWLSCHLLKQHLKTTSCSSFFCEIVHTDTTLKISFD